MGPKCNVPWKAGRDGNAIAICSRSEGCAGSLQEGKVQAAAAVGPVKEEPS